MTYEQIKWASLHDWYEGAYKDGGDGFVCVVRHDVVPDASLTFDDYNALRKWAGY